MKSRTLIAIPARGGSKRLPRKNLAELGGMPMVAHTIMAALESGLDTDVYVCTEDEEIERVSRDFGALVFRIPEAMAGDLVSSTEPCLALLDYLQGEGRQYDFLFNLQPTSPLRTARDISSSHRMLTEKAAEFLVSVTPIDPHYFHWAVVDRGPTWEMYFGREFLKERPLLPPVYRPNGAIKLARTSSIRGSRNFFSSPLAVWEMPEERSIHIATSFDLICARALLAPGGEIP